MKIELNWPDNVPEDHIDKEFIQGMLNRMIFGFYNYGHMRRYENVSSSLKNSLIRLCKYAGVDTIERLINEIKSLNIDLFRTANTEFLIDSSNYNMMEFVKPSIPDTFFKATSKEESPGAIVGGRHVKGKEDYPKTRIQREGD